jgi:hypothetical protein
MHRHAKIFAQSKSLLDPHGSNIEVGSIIDFLKPATACIEFNCGRIVFVASRDIDMLFTCDK